MSLRNRTAKRRGRQNACVWQTWQCYDLRVLSWSSLTLMFSGLLQKDLFKGGWSSAKSFFKQNYCHACHTGVTVVFPLPSCCVSSLISTKPRNIFKTWSSNEIFFSFLRGCIDPIWLAWKWRLQTSLTIIYNTNAGCIVFKMWLPGSILRLYHMF